MCGITGIIRREKITDKDKKTVELLNSKIAHRGPNSEGSFGADHIFVAMRRLSIIDVATGQQPFHNEDKTVSLIANGEIYNFVELRQELEKAGHRFSTNSDCETILHAYEQFGDNFIEKLRGMFVFCLYDHAKKRAIIARDRLGEKPLYLFTDDSRLIFSSECKSLITALKKEDLAIDHDSINLFFHYQYVPEPHTMFEKIKKLPRATMLIVDTERFSITEKKYWNIETAAVTEGQKQNQKLSPPSSPSDIVLSELNELEKIIIRSDVPIGICLSGGIDSSLIAILSKKYSDKKIHALSVGYPNHPENDERKLAADLAHDLSMTFHDIEIHKNEFVEDFRKMIWATDDPVADIASYGYYRLSKAAKEQNIPVLFAGFGGDELFWGYEWVVKSATLNILKKNGSYLTLLSELAKHFRSQIRSKPLKTLASIIAMAFGRGYIFYDLTPGFFSTQHNHAQIFTDEFRAKIHSRMPKSFFNDAPGAPDKNPEINSCVLLYDLWVTGNCIPLGDRIGMAHSVEVRLPLLDYKLIEKVLALRTAKPGDYKLGYKRWLIDAITGLVPTQILERKKRGFTPPTTEWIRDLVLQNAKNLTDGYLVQNRIINRDFVIKILSDIRANKDFLYKMVVLETWISEFAAQ